MATTTTNFGWDIPQSTDLVKDGATAIAALGQDIDTAFVDLKGGTTGQVLAKASNTDLDYTWVAQDDSNAIQNTIVNAKGDIIGASANDVPAVTSVGSDGSKLFANSSATGGLSWQGSLEAGKNFLINGGFDFWARGTSFSVAAFNYPYTADRWTTFNGNACTIAQETSTVPTGANYALKITGGATTSGYELYQGIESVNAIRLAGQQVTASILATGTTGKTHSITVEYSTSVDPSAALGSWTGISPAGSATVTSGTFSTISTSVAIPSNAKSIRFKISVGSLTSGQFAIFGNAQLELGYLATNFSRAGSTIGGELALCQRYYFRINATDAYSNMANSGYTGSTTAFNAFVQHPTTMRTKPSSIEWSGLHCLDVASATITLSNASFAAANTNNTNIAFTASGATASRFAWLRDSGAGTGYLGLSAEL